VLANDNVSIAPETLGQTVFVQNVKPPAVHLVTADLVDEERPWRHDSAKLAQAVMDLLVASQAQNVMRKT
jgi:hypothetical protein